jgi:hypothetical protein
MTTTRNDLYTRVTNSSQIWNGVSDPGLGRGMPNTRLDASPGPCVPAASRTKASTC